MFIGGIFVKNQLEEIKKYFDNITVISPVLASYKLLKKDKLCYNYNYDNIQVYFPRCFYYPGFIFNKVMIDNRYNVVNSLIAKEKIHYDIIHSHFTWPSGYIGYRLKQKYQKPLILTIHENSDWLYHEYIMDNKYINNSWRIADALIRVNLRDMSILKRYNNNVYYIPNGFLPRFKILNKMKCRKILNIPEDKFVIFSLGQIIKRKGFIHLINAMDKISRTNKNIICYIGGNGPDQKKIYNEIKKLKLENCVKLVGFIKGNLLPYWMNIPDIFVLPSISEGTPTVMFESLACGIPFIGTRVGGIPSIITSTEYGLLVNPSDPDDLFRKIIFAYKKEWKRKEIANYALQFSWENNAIKVNDIYNNVLSHCYFNSN